MLVGHHFDPSSYRDRDARVFYGEDGGVCRVLSARALAEWEALSQTRFFQRANESGQIVRTEQRLDDETAPENDGDGWSGVLRHEVIPFVSYPFEWSFGMLQDAALLHLDLLSAALEEDFTLKDGTAYNLQWIGARPIFIDVASFERLVPGRPWAGYRQFCQTFLYGLFLQAYKGVPFQPWLRGRLDGIEPQECWSLMSWRDFFRRGVPSHVWLHAWLQSRPALDQVDNAQALATAGFDKKMLRRNVQGLTRLVRGLRWSPPSSVWSNYADANSYSSADRHQKECFVRAVVNLRDWGLVWDVGCNTGTYSRIAAENSRQVVAIDGDHLAIERFYQALKSQSHGGRARILPLVANLADLAGGLGWRGAERKSLSDRGRPELTLALAFVHHLVIGHGIPLQDLVRWFADLGTSLVIEFVTKQDPMVQRLLRGRRDNYADYEQDVFERLLGQLFDVVHAETLPSGTRKLYFAAARVAS